MEITLNIVDDIGGELIYSFFTELSPIPNVNDTISFDSIGDFVVARREFGYRFDEENYRQVLDYVELRVYLKPIDKEEK